VWLLPRQTNTKPAAQEERQQNEKSVVREPAARLTCTLHNVNPCRRQQRDMRNVTEEYMSNPLRHSVSNCSTMQRAQCNQHYNRQQEALAAYFGSANMACWHY
jgi:hypothetical protein